MASSTLDVTPRISQVEVLNQETAQAEQRARMVFREALLIPFRAICEEGHAVFCGVQAGDTDLDIEPLILFRPLHINSTLALPFSQFSAEAVSEKVIRCTERFLAGKR